MGQFRDLEDQRFGRLIAVDGSKRNKNHKAIWRCICDCGKETNVLSEHLIHGNTRSCGCLNRDVARIRISAVQEANKKATSARTVVLGEYRRRARRRSICFNLTDSQFDGLMFGDCYWCGSKLTNHKVTAGSELWYNGIDRLDSTQGYTKTNCVSSCKICNFMKNVLGAEDFVEHIMRIARKQAPK